ncbi:MAG: hypothetical protein WB996_05230 [Ignavibacteriaceae bacterium]
MNRKLKNTLGLVVLLILILIAGGYYLFVTQRGSLNEKKDELKKLEASDYNTEQLKAQLKDLLKREAVLDSVLASRKFNIPQNLSSIKFFNFINSISLNSSEETKTNVEYVGQKPQNKFFYYEYKLSGSGEFREVHQLIYAIEESKELKKITNLSLSNLTSTNKEGIPRFLVSFTMVVDVYFSPDNRFASSTLKENQLIARPLYDVFYPLIRNDIPPNIDNLLDVQGAKLLAIIPEGAFLSDAKGNTYLLWEGEQVYLGYLTKIDYDQSKVDFITNKGGIIEKTELSLEKESSKSIKDKENH